MAPTANQTMRAVWRLRTGRSSGSSSSSPVGCSLLSPTTADSRRRSGLIDIDGSPNRHHWIKALDVFVAHAHAAVAHRSSDCFWMVGSMNAIAIAELETTGSHHAHISACSSAIGWHNDVSIHDNLLSFDPST